MSVISQSPFRLRANTRKVTKEFRGLRQPTLGGIIQTVPGHHRALPSWLLSPFSACFSPFLRAREDSSWPSACCALGKGENPSAVVFDLNFQISQRPGAIGRVSEDLLKIEEGSPARTASSARCGVVASGRRRSERQPPKM